MLIVSTSNSDITIDPDNFGKIDIRATITNGLSNGDIKLEPNGDGSVDVSSSNELLMSVTQLKSKMQQLKSMLMIQLLVLTKL